MLRNLATLLILSTILTSCQNFKIHDRKLLKVSNCEVVNENDYICNVVCASHEYNINTIKRVSKSVLVNPEDCTDTVGFSVDAWAHDITPTMKALKKRYKR